MAQINLAPGSQYLIVVRRRRRMIYGIAVVVAIATVIAGVVLQIMVSSARSELQKVSQQVSAVETEIAEASEDIKRIQLFESRLTNIGQLLAKHKTWSPYLQELERLLPPETILTSFKGSFDKRVIELSGTTPHIDLAAQTLASLQNEPKSRQTAFTSGTISNVEQVIQTGAAGEVLGQRYKFTMTLNY